MSEELTPYEADVEWVRQNFTYKDDVADTFEDDVADFIADEVFEGSTLDQARVAAAYYFANSEHIYKGELDGR